MKYVKITSPDICNGNGMRVTIWFSGCQHNCKGCQNKWLQDYSKGKDFDGSAISEVYRQVAKPYINGITLSGGDPLYQDEESLKTLADFVKEFKEVFPEKDVWLYTGFKLQDIADGIDALTICRQEVLKHVDYVVDGKFEIDKKDVRLPFRSSSYQSSFKLP